MQGQMYSGPISIVADEAAVNRYVAKVFGWMFLGLMITAITTFAILFGVTTSEAFANVIGALSNVIIIVFLVEVLLVGLVSVRIAKMNPVTAIMLYLLYAVINGFTVGFFALLYAGSTAILAFGITAVSFGLMALYGLFTKSDLTKAGNLLRMGLIGIILLTVVNLFMKSGPLDYVICLAGLFIFLGLTAYDTKKIKTYYAPMALASTPNGTQDVYADFAQSRVASNLAILGALTLYLDFINMFLFILRLFSGGGRK